MLSVILDFRLFGILTTLGLADTRIGGRCFTSGWRFCPKIPSFLSSFARFSRKFFAIFARFSRINFGISARFSRICSFVSGYTIRNWCRRFKHSLRTINSRNVIILGSTSGKRKYRRRRYTYHSCLPGIYLHGSFTSIDYLIICAAHSACFSETKMSYPSKDIPALIVKTLPAPDSIL